ncbi:MAG: sensor domain-containing diguanylate cyclase [Pseudomonadota bacterium]
MEGRKLLDELKRAVSALQIFGEIGKTLTSTLDIKEILRAVLQRVSELLQPTSWSLLLLEKDGINLTYEILINEPSIDRNDKLRVGQGVAGWVIQATKPLLWPDPTPDKRYTPPPDVRIPEDTASLLCVPLRCRGTNLGVMDIRRKGPGAQVFVEEELAMLSTIADYAAIAIENARNFARIEELTITDDLTTLFNVRYLHTLLDSEVLRSSRYNRKFAMIFLDLDHFKQVNDTHGHIHGSQLLKETAEVLKNKIRKVDFAARYGGDEFVIILPEADKEAAVKAAERLRDAIERNTFLKDMGLAVHFTASFGVAAFPEDAQTKVDLIRLADERMYKVKNSTRNRVEAV